MEQHSGHCAWQFFPHGRWNRVFAIYNGSNKVFAVSDVTGQIQLIGSLDSTYTSFQTGAQRQNIHYVLPILQGGANTFLQNDVF